MATRKTTTEEQMKDAAAPAAGGATGLAAGAAIGAAVGGPVGAAVGAAVGGPVGAAIGQSVNWDDAEPQFRSHYESGPFRSISSWEEVAPAYRHGFETASSEEYRGKSWDEVGPTVRNSWKGKGKFEDVEPLIRTGFQGYSTGDATSAAATSQTKTKAKAGKTTTDLGADHQAVIPVVEEELQVGKREVEKGGVRVETKVTSRPVEEQVQLHEEHVTVQRRDVNRPVTSADAAFKEGTIELRETAEEAVVAKRARVVEEVVLRTEGSDRTETVRDTVRKTDVDVKKTAGQAQAGPVQWETVATAFEKDFSKRYGKSGASFTEYTPAYRFGYNLANDTRYQGDWSTVEPEAQRYWEEKNKGTWAEFKDAIHHAWDQVRGKH